MGILKLREELISAGCVAPQTN